jgi:electron transport complex protein RnfC
MGGSMMGFTLTNLQAPLIKTTNCILAPSLTELPAPSPAQACIRCGLCAEACPASLLPQQLFWYAQAEDTDRLEAHNLFDCIECGACSYVCPSKIPLVQYYRAAKGTIRKHIADKEKADRARQRFEFRQSRIDREEAEKEAKRIARKKAADEAKQKLAEQKANTVAINTTEEGLATTNVVVAAVVKASNLDIGFDEQKSKLERMLAAAKNSLESARAPLVPKNPEFPITEEQLIRQQSRIKQTELKVAEAEKKLADFLANKTTSNETPIIEELVPPSIARAQAKINQSPEEKLRANLELLQSRLQKAQEKAEQAKAEASPSANALQLGVEKMQEKIADVQAELDELLKSPPRKPTPEEQNAVADAMERAKARTLALANMSDEEKRADQLKTLEARLQKAKERLAKAEAENDPNVAAFRKAVTNQEEKLKSL